MCMYDFCIGSYPFELLVCIERDCLKSCFYGNKEDEFGCKTCECKEKIGKQFINSLLHQTLYPVGKPNGSLFIQFNIPCKIKL